MKKVINCGHRGTPAYAPENTMKAFRTAVGMGADMIELDARLTRDGVAIVNHDRTFKRTASHPGAANSMTFDEVSRLRFRGEPVPSLEEVILLCKESGIMINIECKEKKAVDEALRLLELHGMRDRAMISEFNAFALARSKSIDPGVETGFLTMPVLPPFPLLTARLLRCSWINPNQSQVNRAFVSAAHRLGLKVIPWTVNDPDVMRRFIDIGVDGFINNVPDVLARIKSDMGVV